MLEMNSKAIMNWDQILIWRLYSNNVAGVVGGCSSCSNQSGSNQSGSNQSGSNQSGSNQSGSNWSGSNWSGSNQPVGNCLWVFIGSETLFNHQLTSNHWNEKSWLYIGMLMEGWLGVIDLYGGMVGAECTLGGQLVVVWKKGDQLWGSQCWV